MKLTIDQANRTKTKKRFSRIVAVLAIILQSSVYSQTFSDLTISGLTPLGFSESAWVDVNNDGNLDFVIAGEDNIGNDFFRIFTNNGDNTFSNTTGGIPTLSNMSFAFGDIDNDEDLDIVIMGRNASDTPVTSVYFNDPSTVIFANAGFTLTPLSSGGLAIVDLDNDGDNDLITTGRDATNIVQTLLYENDGTGLASIAHSLPNLGDGQLVSFDANEDGRTDLVLTGINSVGNRVTDVYLNQGGFTYMPSSSGIIPTSFNDLAIADIDENGFTDLLLTGSGTAGRVTALYLNVNGVFTQQDPGVEALSGSDVAVGDLNNDGHIDLLFTGLDNDGFFNFQYFRSTAANTFTQVAVSFPNLINGDLSLGDLDNDGALDILRSGISELSLISAVSRNDILTKNTAPITASFATLAEDIREDTVTLSWGLGTDAETSTDGLYSNVYLKNLTTDNIILSPESDLTTGYRRVVGVGNAGNAMSKILYSLPEGNYEWAVQAIDNSFTGSTFTVIQNFQICTSVNIGSDTAICVNESIDLNVGTAADVVNWFKVENGGLNSIATNTTAITVQILQRDTIVAQVNKPFSCLVQDTIVIDALPLPDLDLGPDQDICFEEVLSLQVDMAFDSVNWFSANEGLLIADQNNLDFLVTARDTIIVEVFNSNGCLNYDSLIVDVLDLPSFDLGLEQQICFQEILPLQIDPVFDSVNWFSTSRGLIVTNSNTLDFQVVENDTVIAEVFNTNRCVSYDSLVIQVLDLPDFNLGIDQSICFEEILSLQVDAAFDSVNWFSSNQGLLIANQNMLDFTVIENDTLIAEVFNANRCVNYDTLFVEVIDLPDFDIGADTALCFGEEIVLTTASGFANTNWFLKNGTPLLLNSFFYTHPVNTTDTIVAQVFSLEDCVNYDTIVVESRPLPIFTLGDDFAVCELDSVSFSVDTAFDSVNWFSIQRGLLVADQFELTTEIIATDTLWAEVFTDFGCMSYDTVIVTANPLPVFEFPDTVSFCVEDTVILDVGDQWDEVNWFSVNRGFLISESALTFDVTENDQITVEVFSDERCLQTDTIQVVAFELPVVDLGEDIATCNGDTILLAVDENLPGVRWYSENQGFLQDTLFQLSYQVIANDRIWVEVTNDNNCAETDTINIISIPLPVANAGPDRLICKDQSEIIGDDPQDDYQYLWSPGIGLSDSTIANPIAFPDETTTYTLQVTTIDGCVNQDTVVVEVNPSNVIDTGGDQVICLGDQVALGGNPTAQGSVFPYRYLWSPANSLDDAESSNPVAFPQETTTYQLRVFTGDCFEDTVSVTVSVNELPEITVTQDTTIGAGELIILKATGGELYDWLPTVGLNIPTIPDPSASPLSTTTYTVVVTDENGCKSSGDVTVFVENRLFIPNLFTPNGDGENDNFLVYGDGVKIISFRIFNRDGQMVYQTNNVMEAMEVGWDGTYEGTPLDNGNYVWSLQGEYFDGTPLTFAGKNNGTIRLLR
ncbi:MAG: FG-GAP-like repeat-containing protein [Bacteroidota bacterium]